MVCHQEQVVSNKPGLEDEYFVIDPRVHPKPNCTMDDPCCAMHGLRFLSCICDAIPLSQLNLETIKSDCYFALEELDVMSNSHK